jgi:hypothetical protein
MANILKTNVNKIKNNPISAVAGAGAAWFAAKKYANVKNTYLLVGLALVGAVVGANVSYMVKTKMNAPTKADTK